MKITFKIMNSNIIDMFGNDFQHDESDCLMFFKIDSEHALHPFSKTELLDLMTGSLRQGVY